MKTPHTPETVKHTPEPWILDWGRIRDSNCKSICRVVGDDPSDPQWLADRERIVACVNAMAGIPDPESAMRLAVEALEKLIWVHEALDLDCEDSVAVTKAAREWEGAWENARAALAELKKGSTDEK